MISYLGFAIDLGSVTVLRLLRLLRVVRLLNSFPTLRSVTESLLLSFGNVTYVMLMIMIINFVFAVMGMLLFAEVGDLVVMTSRSIRIAPKRIAPTSYQRRVTAGMLLFAQNDPQHFGHMANSIMAIWMIEVRF